MTFLRGVAERVGLGGGFLFPQPSLSAQRFGASARRCPGGSERGVGGRSWLGPSCGLLPALPLPSPSGAGPASAVASFPQLWLPRGLPGCSRAMVTEGRQEGLSQDRAVRRWGC